MQEQGFNIHVAMPSDFAFTNSKVQMPDGTIRNQNFHLLELRVMEASSHSAFYTIKPAVSVPHHMPSHPIQAEIPMLPTFTQT
ncbi:hypothetical protein V6N11_075491 [Hibiscus sabdariffa]|uniref:Uncharacterized protein n=1 Tax=Hibiscus sabdariffa TaxID=183260 RepID=A0ABR2R7C6_9ROSI